MWKPILLCCFALISARADVSACGCDVRQPDTLKLRPCSLCAEAEKHPADAPYFFLKDNNPRKPNRWLMLPRSHTHDGIGTLAGMSPAQRTEFWKAAIGKARELFSGGWGLAMNGDKVRTQCHGHLHIGKLLEGVELDREFVVVRRVEEIPVPRDGTGLWIHPVGDRLHVHLGEQTCETVLLR